MAALERIALLVRFMTLVALLAAPVTYAQDAEEEERAPDPIPSDLERRDVKLPAIDDESFEFGIYGGGMNFDDFNTSVSYGALIAYHVTEDFFVEAGYSQSEVSDTAFRRFNLPVNPFPQENETVDYYNVSLGMNMFPGEIFILDRFAWTSSFFLIGGVGNTEFVDDDKFTFHVGFGLRVLLNDWVSVRFESRDYMFENDLLGEKELKHNFEMRVGLSVFF